MSLVGSAGASQVCDHYLNGPAQADRAATKSNRSEGSSEKFQYNYRGNFILLQTQIEQAMSRSGPNAKFSVDLSNLKKAPCDDDPYEGKQCLEFNTFVDLGGGGDTMSRHLSEVLRSIFAAAGRHHGKTFTLDVVLGDEALMDNIAKNFVKRSKPDNLNLQFVKESSFLDIIFWRTPMP